MSRKRIRVKSIKSSGPGPKRQMSAHLANADARPQRPSSNTSTHAITLWSVKSNERTDGTHILKSVLFIYWYWGARNGEQPRDGAQKSIMQTSFKPVNGDTTDASLSLNVTMYLISLVVLFLARRSKCAGWVRVDKSDKMSVHVSLTISHFPVLSEFPSEKGDVWARWSSFGDRECSDLETITKRKKMGTWGPRQRARSAEHHSRYRHHLDKYNN